MTSFGTHLVNDILPVKYRNQGPLTKGKLNEILVDIARNTPEIFPDTVSRLKRLGDEMATLEGISVGLDDVGPVKKDRDAVLKPYLQRFHQGDDAEKEKVLLEAQNSMLDYTKRHPGTMGEMVRSGGRGSVGQLMKIVGSPVLARGDKDKIVPWLIQHSYAEGLKPAEMWVAGNEARINDIKSHTSVTEPGDLAKILINNMPDKLITMSDCGTTNGIMMKSKDSSIIDRHLAHDVAGFKAGTLVTPQVAQKLSKLDTVVVRSPMTCLAPHGICQKCQGLAPSGQLHALGINVGMRAAQAMSMPLTQLSLSAKHGARVVTTEDNEPKVEGIKGMRQLLEVPQSFMHKATLAEHDGEVTKVETAPQGGHYAWVNDTRHYVGPDLRMLAKVGEKVEAGDMLSNGIPKPDEIVKYKGLGEGRRYLVEALHGVYRGAGIDIDKRHLETLARSVLNHVVITDPGENAEHGFIKGDIVNFNRFNAALA